MKCPKCESDNTQRLEVAYQNGTQNTSTVSSTIGAGVGRGGGVGFSGLTSTSGKTQSALAATCAPPEKIKKNIFSVISTFIGGFFLFMAIFEVFIMFVGKGAFSFSMIVMFVVTLMMSSPFLYMGKRLSRTTEHFNLHELPKLIQKWRESWVCHKCGCIYHQA
jgi:hypothetical protein